MVINYVVGMLLIIVPCLGIGALLFWLGTRLRMAIPFRFLIAFPAGIIGATAFALLTTTVEEYNGSEKVSKHMGFGRVDFTTGDGQLLRLGTDGKKDTYLVNETDKPMALEEIQYGGYVFSGNSVTIIPPHGYVTLYTTPDYYPWQTPPDEIQVSQSQKTARKTWFRYATPEEYE